jgi:hypothetical protein
MLPKALKRKLLGHCIGVPDHPCGRLVFDDDVGAVELERGKGVIGGCCYDLLLGATTTWSDPQGPIGRPGQIAGGKAGRARGLGAIFPNSRPPRADSFAGSPKRNSSARSRRRKAIYG